MKKIFTKVLALCLLCFATTLSAQQLPDPHFEDWSDSFNGDAQLKNWHGSNVEQLGFKFTFMFQKDGRSGKCAYVADKEVGALGITEVGPGYFGLGYAWQKMEGASTNSATAGTYGGISFAYRPDSMVVWIKRTGSNTDSEDFNLLFYSWTGTAKGTAYKNKASKCTSVTYENEESDIRIALDGNECTSENPDDMKQISEGWVRARKKYTNWTRISVPIYYMSDLKPQKCNVIFSAGNYPNFRANSGLYAGNDLYVDDVELIYSNKIQQIYLDNVRWGGFDPNSTDEQVCSLGEDATSIPDIVAKRGVGTLTNSKGKTASFAGRKLGSDELTIKKGKLGEITTLTVKDINGNTRVYKIKFVKEASKNSKLSGITVNKEEIATFNPNTFDYVFELPYGTKNAPVVTVEKQEEAQVVSITQATSVTGKATIKVTAANPAYSSTYTVTFKVAQLKDNTLKDILIDGESLPGFIPSQTIYKVSLPLGTTRVPEITPVSAYEAGAQTIKVTLPTQVEGGKATIDVTTPGNQVPKTYTLNFKLEASSYTKLKELHMMAPQDPTDPESPIIDYIEDFSPDVQTYYVILPMGTDSLPEITYKEGDAYQTVTVQKGGLDGTTNVLVKAASGAQMAYSIVVSTLKSDVSTLKDLIVTGNGTLSPEFNPNVFKYTYSLPDRTEGMPTISWVPGNQFQKIDTVMGGLNATTRINVTAGDGSTSTYQIFVDVAKSNVSHLNGITLDGQLIDGWDKDVLDYTVVLEKGAALPVVAFEKAENLQIVNVRGIKEAPGDYKLTVIAENGSKRQYTIHFRLNLSSDATLAGILLNGVAMTDFDSTQLDYTIILPPGSASPKIEPMPRENQDVVPSKQNGIYTYLVTAEDKMTQLTYTVTVIIQKSENAYLDSLEGIKLNGSVIDGWDKKTFNYVYVFDGALPTLEVKKGNEAQQVSTTMPVGAGIATIVVAPDATSSETNVYTIEFKQASDAALLLDAIYKNGTLIDGWDAETNEYTVYYSDELPVITYQGKSGQEIALIETKERVTIVVTINGESAKYVVNLKQQLSHNALLSAIMLNGSLIDNWNANVYNYTKELAAGEAEPTITWQKAESAQTVVFGQQEAGVYQIVVLSQSQTDTATYTVRMQPQKYNDAELTDIMLDGVSVMDKFVGGVCNGGKVPDGSVLPEITYVKKAGQNVLVSDVSATQQRILVVAESGAQKEYIINYELTNGDNVQLSGILVDGVAISGFDPLQSNYVVKLDERTTQVPAITPVSHIVGQTYIIKYGRVNARTEIEVISKDGQQKGHYYLDFEVRPLTNTSLAELRVYNDAYDETLDVTKTEHTFVYDPSAGIPTVLYQAAEEEQRIEYTRKAGGDTEIKVIAQNGESKTYKVHFTIAKPTVANVLKSLKVNNVEVALSDTIKVDLPYGTTALTIEPEKNFEGQSVIVYNGGVNKLTQIIVSANHPEVADKTYFIKPTVEKYSMTGKLTDLKFKGATVPNFQPDVYNYVVNVTAQPSKTDFVGTAFGGASVTNSAIDAKNKKITLTVASGKVYTVSWYYTNYDSLFDFSGDWVPVAKGVGYKPSDAWIVPADCDDGYTWNIPYVVNLTYTTGKEVTPSGTNGVMLSTLRGAPMNGSVPGMMTLGGMAVSLTSNGNSTSSVTKNATAGTEFKNTPQALDFLIKPLSTSSITDWKMWLTMSDGTNYKETPYSGKLSDEKLNKWESISVPISYDGVGTVSKFNIMLSSCDQENAKQFGGSTIYESSVIYDNVHFSYNSLVKTATINGKNATVDNTNKIISVTLDQENAVEYPLLEVTGEVTDQEQVITWGEEKLVGNNMVRTGTLRNYGEDHSYTDYTLTTTRPAVTLTTLKSVKWGSETINFVNNKCKKEKTAPIMAIPDITITPNSVHQNIAVVHRNDSVIITVTPEKGTAQKYIIYFQETISDNANISIQTGVTLTPSFNPDVTSYSAAVMPNDFKFTKELYQSVVEYYDADTTRFVVTASDQITTKTYMFVKEQKETSANLNKIFVDGAAKTLVAGTPLQVDIMPQVVLFARQDATDTVMQTIFTDSIIWNVKGTSKSNKYMIINKNEADHNAYLAGVLIEGEAYDEFKQSTLNYTIETDSMVDLQFLASNQAQTIEMSLKTASPKTAIRRAITSVPSVIFEIKVTAKDGNYNTYTFKLEAPKGSDATLKGIVVGNDTIKEFYADKMSYTYTLPTAMPKVNLPEVPAIKYITSDPLATVEVEPAVLGETTYITVTSADGNKTKIYDLTITAQKSTYAELNGIMVDGILVPGFEKDRYYYSVQVEPIAHHSIEVSSPDKYIDTTIVRNGKTAIINVTAEDGIHTQRYFVELYEASKSNNATLSDLLVYNKDSARFISVPDFEPMNNNYTINLSASDNMPDVQAVPMVNGQTITPKKEGTTVKIEVLAPDSTASNVYTVKFDYPLDDNKYLEYIKLNGVKMPNFDSLNFVYQYYLPVGDTVIPTIYAESATRLEGQKDPDWSRVDTANMRADIVSYAQNGDSVTYTIFFNKTLSTADTLLAIRYDNKLIDGFTPDEEDYEVPIEAGREFPDSIDYDRADDYQTVTIKKLASDEHSQLYKIEVRAQSGKTKTYTINFVRQLLDITKITNIKINGVPLADFRVDQFEYSSILPAGTTDMPKVEVETEDSYKQKIDIRPDIDSIATKSLNKKSVITVTAENGDYVIYTIHFPVALSKDTTLNMIFYGGNSLPSFVSTVFDYTVELPIGTTNVPQITYIKKDEAQNVDQSCDSLNNWKVFVDVTAEDKQYKKRYTIDFVLAKSDNALLKDIIFEDSLNLITFVPDSMDYIFEVPYDADRDTAHHMYIVPVPSEEGQTIVVDSARYADQFAVIITVTAPNDDAIKQYSLIYSYRKNPDAALKNIWLKGDTIDGFASDTLEYYIEFPVGTDSTQYYTPQNVTYLCSDPLAKVNVKIDQSFTIYIVVTAQDTTSTRTYVIHQTTMQSDDNYLADLIIDQISYRDFDPEKLDYVYYVPAGSTAAPLVEAVPRDERATVSIMPNGIDSVTIITCVAENGKKRTYTILFTNSDIDGNISPKPTDVLVKRIYGTSKILVASLRKKVAFGLYDHAGQLVHYEEGIEPADPNDAIMAVDANGQEVLVDVASENSGTVIELNTNQLYFYVFFEAGEKRVTSGKLIIMN